MKDVTKHRPHSPARLPPSLQPPTQDPPPKPVEVKVKSKAEKMWDIELRKLRSLAKPLDPKMQALGERRFFQWTVGNQGEGMNWKDGGKIDKKWEKVWVPVVSTSFPGLCSQADTQATPVGKILDLMISQSKSPRPKDQDPANVCSSGFPQWLIVGIFHRLPF
jgi:hypothetical protein